MAAEPTWLVVVDEGGGRLLQCTIVPPGRPHLEERRKITNRDPGHEHGRPSPLKGKGTNCYASQGHEAEEDRSRFARKVADWLAREIEALRIHKLAVFAPPRFHGALRKFRSAELALHLEEHHRDLAGLPPASLVKHPAVRRLLPH